MAGSYTYIHINPEEFTKYVRKYHNTSIDAYVFSLGYSVTYRMVKNIEKGRVNLRFLNAIAISDSIELSSLPFIDDSAFSIVCTVYKDINITDLGIFVEDTRKMQGSGLPTTKIVDIIMNKPPKYGMKYSRPINGIHRVNSMNESDDNKSVTAELAPIEVEEVNQDEPSGSFLMDIVKDLNKKGFTDHQIAEIIATFDKCYYPGMIAT